MKTARVLLSLALVAPLAGFSPWFHRAPANPDLENIRTLQIAGENDAAADFFTWPADIRMGDVAVMQSSCRSAAAAVPAATPTGFTLLANQNITISGSHNNRWETYYKISDSNEDSATSTGCSGATTNKVTTTVFRQFIGDIEAWCSAHFSTPTQTSGTGDQASQLIATTGAANLPAVAIGHWAANTDVESLTGQSFTPAGTPQNFHELSGNQSTRTMWRIFNQDDTTEDITIDSGDAGAANFLSGEYFYCKPAPYSVGSVSAAIATSATTAVTYPERAISGDLLIAIVSNDTNVTTNALTGWTLLEDNTDLSPSLSIFYKFSAGETSASFTNPSASVAMPVMLFAIRDANATPIDAEGTLATGASGDPDPPSVTSTHDDELIMVVGGIDNDNTTSNTRPTGCDGSTSAGTAHVQGQGYTTVTLAAGGSAAGTTSSVVANVCHAETAGAKNYGAFTLDSDDTWHAHAFAIRGQT